MILKTSLRILAILLLLLLRFSSTALATRTKEHEKSEDLIDINEHPGNLTTIENGFPTITLSYINQDVTTEARDILLQSYDNVSTELSRSSDQSPTYVTEAVNTTEKANNVDSHYYEVYDYDTSYDDIHLDYNDIFFAQDVLRQISFTKTLYFCEYIFSAMYGEYDSFPDSGVFYGNESVTVIHEEKFINVCIPFYNAYNNCSDRIDFTFCAKDKVLFLNKHDCSKPSDNDVHFEHLLAAALLSEDEKCFQSVCNGNTRIVDYMINGIELRLFRTENVYHRVLCDDILQNYYLINDDEEVYAVTNRYWPCCFPDFTILLAKDPKEYDMLRSWNYLPRHCQTFEFILLVVFGIMTTISIISNAAVIIVMLSRHCSSLGLEWLNVSLAISDLFLSLFVMAPAVNMHLVLMNGDNVEIMKFQNKNDIMNSLDYSENQKPLKSGYYLFSSFIFSCCAMNSIHTHFSLSYIRFRTNSQLPLLDRFPTFRPKLTVAFSWLASLLISLVVMFDSDGGFDSEWNPYAKLPWGVSTKGKKAALTSIMTVFGIYCAIIIAISVMAIYYHRLLLRQKSSNETTESSITDAGEKNLMLLMILMTTLFTISTASAGIALVIYIENIHFYLSELLSSICWWIFLCSTSWNPWLYNLSSWKFMVKEVQRTKYFTARLFWCGSGESSENNSHESIDGEDEHSRNNSQQNLPTISATVEERYMQKEVSV